MVSADGVCDNTNEALTGLLRPGNAGSNTALDHIAVIDQALAPATPSTGTATRTLFRFDGAGASKALPDTAWMPAIDGDGEPRDGPAT